MEGKHLWPRRLPFLYHLFCTPNIHPLLCFSPPTWLPEGKKQMDFSRKATMSLLHLLSPLHAPRKPLYCNCLGNCAGVTCCFLKVKDVPLGYLVLRIQNKASVYWRGHELWPLPRGKVLDLSLPLTYWLTGNVRTSITPSLPTLRWVFKGQRAVLGTHVTDLAMLEHLSQVPGTGSQASQPGSVATVHTGFAPAGVYSSTSSKILQP